MGLNSREETWLRDLLALYRRKNELLAEMLKLTSARAGLDEAERPEEILELVEARQVYMKQVDDIDAEIMKLDGLLSMMEGEGGPGEPAGECAVLREQIGELRCRCVQMVKEMQDLDRLQMPRLVSQLSRFREMREKVKLSRRTLNAYRAGLPSREGVFVDKMK
ncbi:MAG: hypothetical protein K6T65_15455 [Peptococcaceae bacterium]|nr:hypothetical protein [Peptococcaceae bacterium]